tara:strand:- start:289 stop:1068 length:780 start_codon:yes stop_codon:yes gene_type:complete
LGIENIGAQLDFFDFGGAVPTIEAPPLQMDPEPAPVPQTEVLFVRNLRAKNYRLTLRRDGVPIATIPARGTEKAARKFVRENADWLSRMQDRHQKQPRMADRWMVGTTLMWRGEMLAIRRAVAGERPQVCLGADVFRVVDLASPDLRPTLESAFKSRARIELTSRTWELAALTKMDVKKVSVRNQRTRWGSCTEGGVISLNWRLILAPSSVSDYVIYHELMHLREMNHSKRFWAAVAEVCPDWEEGEAWLNEHGSYLGL